MKSRAGRRSVAWRCRSVCHKSNTLDRAVSELSAQRWLAGRAGAAPRGVVQIIAAERRRRRRHPSRETLRHGD